MKSNLSTSGRTRWWLLAAIPLGVVVLWLIGVGIFRQPKLKPTASASTITPPAQLRTALDFLAQGDYEFEQDHYDPAIAAYTRAIELDPDFAEAYNNRAYIFMTKEDYAPALSDLDRAITLRPDYVNALMNRGDIYNYYFQIDYERAVMDYDRVLETDPDARTNTSVCGHRMLALHHGWTLGVFLELVTRGVESGCPAPAAP